MRLSVRISALSISYGGRSGLRDYIYSKLVSRMAIAADYSDNQLQAALGLAFSYLVNSIEATDLLPVARSRQLITERQRSECASEPDPYKKAEKFLENLQRAVNGDSSKFHTFVQVLEETNHANIASRLRGS